MLRAYGDVVVAPSAAAARRQLAKRPAVSAALFDVFLPDGSGLDVLAEFRRLYPTDPAVVVTGHVKGDVVNAAYDLDAGVMSKPFNRDRMQHWVERVMTTRAPVLRTPEADALGERVEALKTLFGHRPCDARIRYQIGEIVAELKRHPAHYGASAVATAASAMGEALPSLYRHARVAQRWRVGEFGGVAVAPHGGRSHPVLVAPRVSGGRERRQALRPAPGAHALAVLDGTPARGRPRRGRDRCPRLVSDSSD